MRKLCHAAFLILILLAVPAMAQINTDRMMLMGRNALYYEDYVLSIRRFNMVISAKPYLSEPYFYRGLAKFYLEDYIGAQNDCAEAIERNPFLPDNYRLRGLCHINLKQYAKAIDDYKKLLEIEPEEEDGWFNMTLCHLELKEYDEALGCIDSMLRIWPRKASLFTLKAQACITKSDTVAALACVDRALELNPYEGDAWNIRAAVHAQRGEFKEAEAALDITIQQSPRVVGHYINRALTRYHQQNLRGAMDDYDTALEMDSVNYIGHFNRGLLRAQVGDDNRAIEDFNYVLKIEPDNMIALFNRALMLNNTGDYKGAIDDINTVIKEYPNFWAGYQFRAEVRRKMGNVKGAEQDEFKVMKAQLDKRYGVQTAQNTKTTRKVSDHTMEDYDKLVEADTDDSSTPEYESEYRGKVQNRKTELSPEPFLVLTYYTEPGDFQRRTYNEEVERMNGLGFLPGRLTLTHKEVALDEARIQKHFSSIQTLSDKIAAQPDNALLYFVRAIDEYLVQDFEKALADADKAIELDDSYTFIYYIRMQIRLKNLEVRTAERQDASPQDGTKWAFDETRAEYMAALDDCDRIISKAPAYAGYYYNRGNICMKMGRWNEAVEAFTQAIALRSDYAEAYYNRGVTRILMGDYQTAIPDLSRAGEQGLYKAYNLIKRYRNKTEEKKE